MEIILKDLPKISNNKFYAGIHWTARKKMKDAYTWIVKSQFKDVLSKSKQYEADYLFHFKKNPLDASNCVGMAKMIEDIIFENDKYDIVLKMSLSSRKAKQDEVIITIKEI